MTKTLKKAWLKALRSGKYTQGQLRLRTMNGEPSVFGTTDNRFLRSQAGLKKTLRWRRER